jgi:hypothetical protein
MQKWISTMPLLLHLNLLSPFGSYHSHNQQPIHFVGFSPYQHNHTKASNIDITTRKTKDLLVVASTHQRRKHG